MGNGPLLISNLFLATSLLTLAQRSSGCSFDDEGCDSRVYGFKSSSLITVTATISGLLASFLLPFFGAMIDYTNHRKLIGSCIAGLLITIQAVQIGTVQATWFPMAVLQAINGFLHPLLRLSAFSYLPEIRCDFGDELIMTKFSSQIYSLGFSCQLLFLVTVIGLSLVLNAGDVLTAQISQAVNVFVSGSFYFLGYYFLNHKQARREQPQGSSLFIAGFKQVIVTTKGIYQQYPKTLSRFLLGVLFGNSAISAFTTVAVTFLVEVVNLNSRKTGLVFFLVLLSTIPGSQFASFVTRKTGSPVQSMKLCLISLIVVNFVSFLSLTTHMASNIVWICAVFWGFMLGWFYPTEVNIYSTLIPEGQDSELAGFFLYCTQILSWLPPFVFTIMNENGISLAWGGVHLNIYLFISWLFYQMMPCWTECLESTSGDNKILGAKIDDFSVSPNSV